MKRYRLVEANNAPYQYRHVTILEQQMFAELEQQMLTEGVIDWFKKTMSSLSGKVITIDWSKTEQEMGGPVPPQIREKVEKYVNGKSFKLYKFWTLALAITALIGLSGALVMNLKSGIDPHMGNIAILNLFVTVIGGMCAYIIADKLLRKDFKNSGIANYEKKLSNLGLSKGTSYENAWSAVLHHIKTKDEAGENWGFSKFLWFLIILLILTCIVKIGLHIMMAVA